MRTLPLALALAGCAVPDGNERIAVPHNDLGVVEVETTRFVDQGDVFQLRGYDATGGRIVLVQKRIGDIADLPPGDSMLGAELTMTFEGHEGHRVISRETQRFPILPTSDPAVDGFLTLSAVKDALGQANIAPLIAAPEADTSYQQPGATWNCDPSWLNANGKRADQCCYSQNVWGGPWYMYFVNASINKISYREGVAPRCTQQNGAPCTSDDTCYYGPNGWSQQFYPEPYNGSQRIRTYGAPAWWAFCTVVENDWGPVEFPSVYGSTPSGSCGGPKSYPPKFDAP